MSATQHDRSQPVIEKDAADPLLHRIIERMDAMAVDRSRVSPIRLRTLDDLERFGDIALNSSMVPKSYRNKNGTIRREDVILAIQMGSELGLPPMQSLLNIAVIGGRPSVWGDAMPGLCRASGLCQYIKEWSEGEDEDLVWYCEAKRKDDPHPVRQSFSVADAKVAKLWGKRGHEGQDTPWITNPGRMVQMRARGFCLRDTFPDVLRGLISAEEAHDISLNEVIAATEAAPSQFVSKNLWRQPTEAPLPSPSTTRRDEINASTSALDEKPHDPTKPEYPWATNQGGKMYDTGSAWIEAITGKPRGLIARMVAVDALDKLREAREMNRGVFEQVRDFDPLAVAQVEAAIAAALGEEPSGYAEGTGA